MPILECKIRRQGGTHTGMPNPDESVTQYHFKPIDPTREDSPHVADVADQAHYARFIAVAPDVYVPFESAAPKVSLAKPVSTEKLVVAAQPDGTPALKFVDERPSYNDLKAGISKSAFSQEQLREWMAAEEASDTPRPGYIAAIVKALT